VSRVEEKKKLAVYTATGCRACEQGILDLNYQVNELGRIADPVFWPYVLGTPWAALPDGIDVALFSGAIRTEADRQAAQKLREKSQLLVAVGACAAFGGLPGLANLADAEDASAGEAAKEGAADEGKPALPAGEPETLCLSQVVEVDYFVPGCPPTQNLLWAAVLALLSRGELPSRLSYAAGRLPAPIAEAIASGVLPPRGSTFAGEKAVCGSCSRVKEEKKFGAVKRAYQEYQETGRCLLEQGLICQGVATQEGCGGLCTGVGVPCRGCFGKAPATFDPGAKMVTAIASTFDAAKAEEVAKLVDNFVDLAGTFYRYSLPAQCAVLAEPPQVPAAEADKGCATCRG
jgi:F420-non-reducing hydrogenase small subunit